MKKVFMVILALVMALTMVMGSVGTAMAAKGGAIIAEFYNNEQGEDFGTVTLSNQVIPVYDDEFNPTTVTNYENLHMSYDLKLARNTVYVSSIYGPDLMYDIVGLIETNDKGRFWAEDYIKDVPSGIYTFQFKITDTSGNLVCLTSPITIKISLP